MESETWIVNDYGKAAPSPKVFENQHEMLGCLYSGPGLSDACGLPLDSYRPRILIYSLRFYSVHYPPRALAFSHPSRPF